MHTAQLFPRLPVGNRISRITHVLYVIGGFVTQSKVTPQGRAPRTVRIAQEAQERHYSYKRAIENTKIYLYACLREYKCFLVGTIVRKGWVGPPDCEPQYRQQTIYSVTSQQPRSKHP